MVGHGIPIFGSELSWEPLTKPIPGVSTPGTVFLVAGLFFAWYLIGTFVKFLSRGASAGPSSRARKVLRLVGIERPSPTKSSHEALEPLLKRCYSLMEAQTRLSHLEWRQYYPLAKAVVMQGGSHSLLPTYQNKYTLHRSLASLCALAFLAASLLLVVYVVLLFIPSDAGARLAWWWWSPTMLVTIWGHLAFTHSYHYNWTLWGDTIITESLALLSESR